MNEFKEKFASLRKDKGLSRPDLAKILGVSGAAVGMYERGERLPKKEIMDKIVEYFGVSRDYLLTKDYDLSPDHTRANSYMISDNQSEYLVEEAFDTAKFIFENPEYVELFKLMKDVKKDKIKFVTAMLEKII